MRLLYVRFVIIKVNAILSRHDNVFYLPNGVDLNYFVPSPKKEARIKLGLHLKSPVLLFVSAGALTRPEKRKDKFDRFVAWLESKMSVEIQRLYMSGVSRDIVPLYYSAADMHVLTSDFEGSPNSVKEALACGCPVVSRNVGDVQNLTRGIPNCFVVANDSILFSDDIVEFLLAATKLTFEERTGISEAFQLKNLSKESVASQLLDIYGQI